jgi:hypothetical protein
VVGLLARRRAIVSFRFVFGDRGKEDEQKCHPARPKAPDMMARRIYEPLAQIFTEVSQNTYIELWIASGALPQHLTSSLYFFFRGRSACESRMSCLEGCSKGAASPEG